MTLAGEEAPIFRISGISRSPGEGFGDYLTPDFCFAQLPANAKSRHLRVQVCF
jgi:hypothetical protein